MTPTDEAIDDLTDEQIDALTDDERKERAAKAIAPILAEIRANPLPIEQRRSGRTSPEWLKMAAGIFEGSETFEEAVKYGEAWRESFRSKDAPRAAATEYRRGNNGERYECDSL